MMKLPQSSIMYAALVLLYFFASCTHVVKKPPKSFASLKREDSYAELAKAIVEVKADNLKECNCMKAFYRDFLRAPDDSARYIFDQKVLQESLEASKGKTSVNLFALGSGSLLSEIAAISLILEQGKSVNVYIYDFLYIFYGQENYKEEAKFLANNPDKRPENWQILQHEVWNFLAKEPNETLLWLDKTYKAIDEFKKVLNLLDKRYNTQSQVTVVKIPKSGRVELPDIDVMIAVDAYMDLGLLLRPFEYQLSPLKNPISVVTLNKVSPAGIFYEPISKEPVRISVYSLSHQDPNAYEIKIKERLFIAAKKWQLEMAPKDGEKFIQNIFNGG